MTEEREHIRVSSSKLGAYGDCPKYANAIYGLDGKKRRKDVKEAPSVPAQFGTVIHELLERNPKTDEEVKAIWDEIWQRDTINIGSDYGEEDNVLTSVVDYEQGLAIIQKFRFILPEDNMVLAREHKFELEHKAGNITFNGQIDLVFIKEHHEGGFGLGVMDYKSWRRSKTIEQMIAAIQLNLYAIAALNEFLDKLKGWVVGHRVHTDKVWVGYGMVRYGNERGIWLKAKHLRVMLDHLLNIATRMRTATKFPPKVSSACAYCPIRGMHRGGCKAPERLLAMPGEADLKKTGLTREEYLLDRFYKLAEIEKSARVSMDLMKMHFRHTMETAGVEEIGAVGRGLRLKEKKSTVVTVPALQALGLSLQDAWDQGLLNIAVTKARELAKSHPNQAEFDEHCIKKTSTSVEKR